MLYAATIPLLSTNTMNNSNKSSQEFSSYYIDFDNDDDMDNQRLACFSVGLRVHGMCGRRPHIVYSNQNNNQLERVPKILPLFHFLFYEKYDPEQGQMANPALELPVLKQLVLDLAPHIVFPTLGYDGEYDPEDGSVNGQGRYVYEDGSVYTGESFLVTIFNIISSLCLNIGCIHIIRCIDETKSLCRGI